jgi:chorismate mutase
MPVRGIRGATTCTPYVESVLTATKELLLALVKSNPTLNPADIASVLFTVTPDLQITFPARVARDLGWTDIPLLDALEINVPGSLPHCIRVLIHWNTDLPQNAVQHVYLHDAVKLRPDLTHEN